MVSQLNISYWKRRFEMEYLPNCKTGQSPERLPEMPKVGIELLES
ncbi:MAG: hypothetical protein ACUVTL_10710 [Thermoproteota archaeon]